MPGNVWRIPTILGLMAGSSLLLFGAGALASAISRRQSSAGAKLVARAMVVVVAISSAVAIRATSTAIARALSIRVEFVDPGPLGYLAPMAFAAFAFAVAVRALERVWVGRRALLFYGWLFVFSAANVINRCTPGWCVAIGFPFTWLEWSDFIVMTDASRLEEVLRALPAITNVLLDLGTFVLVAALLTRVRGPERLA